MNSSGTLKIARNGYIVMAVVFCALGIFLMTAPEKAVKIICVLAGILFIADGIIKIIGYFSRDFYCLAFQFDLGFGILMIAVGILILVRREAILRLIFVIFGLVILTDALLRIQMSVEAKKFGLKLWWAVLLIAVTTGIFGMLLLVDPAGGAKLTVIFTGVAFLLEGILKLCVVVYTVKIRENENVVWEDEFREI
ncbi:MULTISPECIES: DUF308 domain-containing protein [unclassified Ruminococcus]|uniref:HdeD family acid-resistance protein n=1 Tax=unclassified Ruminococcus TaxID=2608920 RepID=UPI00319E2518